MEADRRALLDLIGDVQNLLDIRRFRVALLGSLARIVPCDWISLNDLGPEPGDATVLVDPPFAPEDHERFARLAHENPLIARYQRTRDGRAYRFSDVATADELHSLALYREFYGPLELEHQIAFTLPQLPGRMLGVALSRRERDFSDGERALLNEARPFLIQAYRNSIEYSRLHEGTPEWPEWRSVTDSLASSLLAHGLTPRESASLACIATGRSDEGAAATLGISPRTLQKHLERCYRKLGVTTRSDAATFAWSLLSPSSPRATPPARPLRR